MLRYECCRIQGRWTSGLIAGGFALAVCAAAWGDVVVWDGGGDGTSWHDRFNWNPDQLPGPGDDVQIVDPGDIVVVHSVGVDEINSLQCVEALLLSGGSLTIAAASEIADFELRGGTFDGAGDLTLVDLFVWTGGTMRGTGTTFANGGIELGGNGSKVLQRDLENPVLARFSGGTLYINEPAVFLNRPGAEFDSQSDHQISWLAVGPGTFDNQGTFRKSGGAGATDVRVEFDNTGGVEIETGTVLFRRRNTHTGDITGAGTLQLATATHTIEPSSSVVVSELILNSGTTDFHGTLDLADGLQSIGGTHTFHADAEILSIGDMLELNGGTLDLSSGEDHTVATYVQTGGTLAGDADVTVTDPMTWNGGTLAGTGTLFANGGIELGGNGSKVLQRDLENPVLARFSGGTLYINEPAVFLNRPGAEFDSQSDHQISWLAVGPGTFDNQGTFRKSGGAGATDVRVEFDNTGGVEIETGTVLFRARNTHTGDITGAGTLQLATATHTIEPSSSVVVSELILNSGTTDFHGTLDLADGLQSIGGTHTFHADAEILSIGDMLELNGGTLDLSSGEDHTVATYVQTGGTLAGDADVTVTDPMTWNGGTLAGTGTTFANGGIELGGNGSKILQRDLENGGLATFDTGTLYINEPAVFRNLPGGTFDNQADRQISWLAVGPGTIENQGTFLKSAGSGNTDVRVNFTTSGVVEVRTGTLVLREGDYLQTAGSTRVDTVLMVVSNRKVDLQGGWLGGDGRIECDVENVGGEVRPGALAGALTIEGDYVQGVDGTLVIEIGGTVPVDDHDVLVVEGDAMLGGFLTLPLLGGFLPEVGQVFTILTTTGQRLDEFAEVDCPAIYRVDYLDQAVALTVTNEQPYGDINCDGLVSFGDILRILAAWGECPGEGEPCPEDLDQSGAVDFADILEVLANWS